MIWVVQRPVATWMITIALLVFGWVSYQRLPLNLMPDLSYPTITIRTDADGYAPEEVESQVSMRIEESVATTPGLRRLESRSKANGSDVILSFQWGTKMDQAIQDVREQLQFNQLPDDVDRPLILRYDPTLDPILRIAISKPIQSSAEATLTELRQIAEKQIKKDLEAMDGVAAVRLRGGFEPQTQVLLREDWMMARQVSIEQVIQTIQAENINIPGGSILEGRREYLVRTINAFTNITDIQNIKIRRPDGVSIRLSDIAEIKEGYKERQVLSRLNTEESVELEIFKTADANIVTIANQIKERLGTNKPITTKTEESMAEATSTKRSGSGRRTGTPPKSSGGRGGTPQESKTIRESLPTEISMTILDDQAKFIESAINNLRGTAFMGAVLAVIILFLFLRNFRSTVIIGVAIPMSIICTFIPMYIYDVSLNLMSLGGLALGIGMLVDNAVVALENIQVHLEQGKSRKQAASDGTQEVTVAIISSTLTTISVFLPISFVDGIAGQIFGDLSLSVVFSLMASLGVALYFVPMLASSDWSIGNASQHTQFPILQEQFSAIAIFREDYQAAQGWRKALLLLWAIPRVLIHLSLNILGVILLYPLLGILRLFFALISLVVPKIESLLFSFADIFHLGYSKIDAIYQRILPNMLRRPSVVLGGVIIGVVSSVWLGMDLGSSLLPELHQGRFVVDIDLPIGTPLSETANISKMMEKRINSIANIQNVYAVIGADTQSNTRAGAGEHSIQYRISLQDNVDYTKEQEIIQETRDTILHQNQNISPDSSWKMNISRPALFSFDNPLELVVFAKELPTLRNVSQAIQKDIQEIPSITDVQNSVRSGYPEIQIEYDRDSLKRYNLSTSTVAQMVKNKIQGEKASTISLGEDRIDLVVQLTASDRSSIDKLKRININPNLHPPIPLSSVAQFTETEGPSEIRRIDQQRSAVISANMDGFNLAKATSLIADKISDYSMDDVFWEFAGQSKEMEDSITSMQFAIALAIFLVYVIMASAFESILHPFVILFSVPLAIIGVVLGLWWLQMPISVITLIGAIVLAGVVVNNAIVLVDTINRKRENGYDKNSAIYEATKLRLRPIAITTLTTVLGLVPLALGYGDGAEIQQPLAITIISGLLSSTVLTLVVIPIIYQQLTQLFEKTTISTMPVFENFTADITDTNEEGE